MLFKVISGNNSPVYQSTKPRANQIFYEKVLTSTSGHQQIVYMAANQNELRQAANAQLQRVNQKPTVRLVPARLASNGRPNATTVVTTQRRYVDYGPENKRAKFTQ